MESKSRFEKIVEILRQSKEWNNCDNPESIIRREFPIYEKYSDSTIVPFLKAALIREARAKTLDIIEGVVFGGCDRKGTKLPVSWPVLLKNGKLIKIVSWNPNIIPQGIQFVKLTGTLNSDFQNYGDIEVIETKPFTNIQVLQKAALSINNEDVWEHQKEVGEPVLVKGTIKWVNPLYERDQDGNRGSPIPIVDQKGRPVFEIVLAFNGLVELHLRFIEQNRGIPFVGLEDINLLLKDAVKIFPDDPESQAKFIQTALKDRSVIGIGEIMNISERYTQDEVRTLTIYIRLAGIIEVKGENEVQAVTDFLPITEDKSQKKLDELVELEEPDDAQDTEEPVETEEPSESEESVETEESTDKQRNAGQKIDLLVEQIKEYCELVGKQAISVNKEELRNVGIGEEMSDLILGVALKKVQDQAVLEKFKPAKKAKTFKSAPGER